MDAGSGDSGLDAALQPGDRQRRKPLPGRSRPGSLAAFLEPLAPDLERQPENARFIFNDETRQLDLLREAIIGRSLDVPATIQAINDGLNAGQHQIPWHSRPRSPPWAARPRPASWESPKTL